MPIIVLGGLALVAFMAISGRLEGLPPLGFGGRLGTTFGLPTTVTVPLPEYLGGVQTIKLPELRFTSGFAGAFGERLLVSAAGGIPTADSVEGQSLVREKGLSMPDFRERSGRI